MVKVEIEDCEDCITSMVSKNNSTTGNMVTFDSPESMEKLEGPIGSKMNLMFSLPHETSLSASMGENLHVRMLNSLICFATSLAYQIIRN